MRSPDAARRLADLDRGLMEDRIRSMCDRRAAGDTPGIFEACAPDVVFRCNSWRGRPGTVEFRGRDECFAAMRETNILLENLGSRFDEFVIDGNVAIVRRTARLRNRGTGATEDVAICDVIRFSDGRIVKFEEFPDTGALGRVLGAA